MTMRLYAASWKRCDEDSDASCAANVVASK